MNNWKLGSKKDEYSQTITGSVEVRCPECGKIHTLSAEDFDSDLWTMIMCGHTVDENFHWYVFAVRMALISPVVEVGIIDSIATIVG